MSPGLVLQLDNEQQFGRALSNLERILTRLDSRLDATGSALTIFERRLAAAGRQSAGVDNITRLTNGLSRLDDELRGISPRIARFFRDLEEGFRSGRIEQAFTEQGRRLAEEFIQSIERELGISSPSRVMRRIADDIALGFEQGIDAENFGDEGRRAANEFTDSFEQEARAGVSRLRGIFNNIGTQLIGRGQNQIALGQDLLGTGLQQLTAGGLVSFFQGRLIGTVAEFDQTLNAIRVFGRLTEEELANVQGAILDFSAATVFGTGESAEAFLGLLKAGLDTADALSVLPEIGNLAAASQLDLATATNLAIRAASAFQIPFSDINRIIDTFIGGADISTAEVMDLANALGFVGSQAAALQIPVEDVTAALAALNDQGIVGERAGTGLRAALSALAAPTTQARDALRRLGVQVQDEQGNFVGMSNLLNQFREAVQRLRDAGAGEAQILEILSGLGDRNAASAILALINTTEEGTLIFDEYVESLESANDAQTVASALMDTFRGSLTGLQGTVESLLIRAFLPLINDGIKPVIDFLIVAINRVSELPQPILTAAAAVSVLVPALVTLVGAFKVLQGLSLIASGGILTQLGTLLGGTGAGTIVSAGAAATGALPALAALLTTLVGIGAAVGVVIVGGTALVRMLRQVVSIIRTDPDASGAFNAFLYSLQVLFDTVLGVGREVVRIFDEFVSSLFRFGDSLSFALGPDSASVTRFFTGLSRVIFSVAGALNTLREALAGVSGGGLNLGTVVRGIESLFAGVGGLQLPQLQLPNIDLSGIVTSIQTALNNLNLGSLDLSTLQTNITNSLQNLSFDNVQTIFETHFDTIVNLIVAAAGIVFGGPVGIVLGIGKLVVTAIENDFLGIRTLLEESGIAAAAETAFNDLLNTVQGVIDAVFGGGEGGGGLTLSPEVRTFLDDVGAGIQTFIDTISGILNTNVAPGLEDLGEGIQGFLSSLSGAETEGLDDLVLNIARVVGVVIGSVVTPLIEIGGLLVGGVLSGIGAALPQIGEAISNLVSALSDIGQGDLGGAAINILQTVANVFNALIQFPIGIADQVINFLERLTGVDLTGVSEGLQAFADAIGILIDIITIRLDSLKRSIEVGFAEFRLSIIQRIAELRQTIIDITEGSIFGTIDIAPNIGIDLTETQVFLTTTEVADEIERLISEQLAQGEIDLTAPITLDTPLGEIDSTIADQLLSQSVLDRLSVTARDRIQDALRTAIAEDPDSETTAVLRTAAERLGLDVAEGYATGIEDNTATAEDATRTFAQDGIQTPLQQELETGSPSQWMFRFGFDVVQGLIDGLNAMLAPLQTQTNLIFTAFQQLRDQSLQAVNELVIGFTVAAVRAGVGISILKGQIDTLTGALIRLRTEAAAAIATLDGLGGGNLPTGLTFDDTPTFGGGRQHGGRVLPGRFYETNEDGSPELLISGGRRFLIPSQEGMIVPSQPLPSSSTSNVSFGGNTYQININGAGDPSAVAAEVERAIERRERNNPARRRLGIQGVT